MTCLSEPGGGSVPGAKGGTFAGLRDSFRPSPFFIHDVGEFDIFSVAVRGGTKDSEVGSLGGWEGRGDEG